jgi:hypothetical protein
MSPPSSQRKNKEVTDGGGKATGTACPQEDNRSRQGSRRRQGAKRSSGTKATASAAKATTKKKTPATPRVKKGQPVVVEPADVATLAYLLWERGEPGDAAEHWSRAEQELQAA